MVKSKDDPNVKEKEAITVIDNIIKNVATSRAERGATLNRLDFNVANLNSQATVWHLLLLKLKTLTWQKKCLR